VAEERGIGMEERLNGRLGGWGSRGRGKGDQGTGEGTVATGGPTRRDWGCGTWGQGEEVGTHERGTLDRGHDRGGEWEGPGSTRWAGT